ncbi:MAG: hypothetical protein ACXVRH_15125 [Thermoleophilaceae bacterium]
MPFKRILLPAVVVSALVAVVVGPGGIASAASTSLHDVLSQLRRNSKVSERLNAGFFRAPQTQSYAGSAFRPTDSDTAFSVSTTDGGLSLKPATTGGGTTGPTGPSGPTGPATAGSFEVPLLVPNRAKVVKVQASYNDPSGNDSAFKFEVVKYGVTGDSPSELLSDSSGISSTDGKKETKTLGLASSGFQVNNSTSRYVLRVTITDPSATAKLYGITVQYVIGKGVPGAPA